MVREEILPPFLEWIGPALTHWSLMMVAGAVAVFFAACLIAIVRHGPGRGISSALATMASGLWDLLCLSPGRVLGMSILAFREAIRRRVLTALVLFLVVLMFIGWFLDPSSPNPAQLYVGHLLTAVSYLVILIGMFLAAFSLPADLSNKTIYTVVTKPVRPSEIVLGRILGFAAIGTLMLAIMGLASYVFVIRALDHTHTVDPSRLKFYAVHDESGDYLVAEGNTSEMYRHEHAVVLKLNERTNQSETRQGHWHTVQVDERWGPVQQVRGGGGRPVQIVSAKHGLSAGDLVIVTPPKDQLSAGELLARNLDAFSVWRVQPLDGDAFELQQSDVADVSIEPGDVWRKFDFAVSTAQGAFTARVPIYAADLSFRQRDGSPKKQGLNVGNVWEYRSFIEGGGQMAAIWTFAGIREEDFPPERFPLGIPLELTLSVKRSHKGVDEKTGDIKRFIGGSLRLVDPNHPDDRSRWSPPINFLAKEYAIDRHYLPRKIPSALPGQPDGDLFGDYVVDGKLAVRLQCMDPNQYFGVALPDLYIKAADGSFRFNFVKGFYSIWLQMVVVICAGVLFSTFLNGAVAMLATLFAIIVGMFTGFVQQLATGTAEGGGPFESLLRVVKQAPLTVPLEEGPLRDMAQFLDAAVQWLFQGALHLFPQLGRLDSTPFVVHGFDIPASDLAIQTTMVLGFFVPVFIAAHFVLKVREVAK